MPNLPISPHLTVVSVTPAADAASATPGAAKGGADGDFSSLLAGQLAAKPAVLPPDRGGSADKAAPAADPAVPADAATGLAVIAFVPLATPAAAATAAGPAGEAPRAGAERATGLARALEAADEHAAGEERQVLPEGASPSAEAAANFAVPDGRGSAKTPVRTLAEELAPVAQPAAKPAQVEAGAADRPEAVPALAPHGAIAARHEAPAPAASPAPTVTVESRVASPAWGAELGQKVVWLVNQQQQIAHINVTPPQLGPIEIRLNLAHDQASATFVSPHAAVREAIEAALPRLRDMLAESGLTLGNVDVSAHSFNHARQDQARGEPGGRSLVPAAASAIGSVAGAALGPAAAGLRAGTGLVDIFA
jgi:flagellar hook-length control protein FliK